MGTATKLPMLARYPASEAMPAFRLTYPHEGTDYVVGFDAVKDLRETLVANAVDGRAVEYMISWVEDALEAEHYIHDAPAYAGDGHPLDDALDWNVLAFMALASAAMCGPPIWIGFAARWYWSK